jgi:hypothetical protein
MAIKDNLCRKSGATKLQILGLGFKLIAVAPGMHAENRDSLRPEWNSDGKVLKGFG